MKIAKRYYPFGMVMPGRSYTTPNYRYGFNGKEKDDEVTGVSGTQYDYGFRIYNPRLGKFLTVDPLTVKYPELTPYQFATNRVIDGIDIDGREWGYFGWFINMGIHGPVQGTVITIENWWDKKVETWKGLEEGPYQMARALEKSDNYNNHVPEQTARELNRQQFSYGLNRTTAAVAEIYDDANTLTTIATLASPLLTAEKAAVTAAARFSQTEVAIVNEATNILASTELKTLQQAFVKGVSNEVKVAGRTILYEPQLPASGFTLAGEKAFVLGPEAFKSQEELTKTLLQELYRLEATTIAKTGSASSATAKEATKSASSFADDAFENYFKTGQ